MKTKYAEKVFQPILSDKGDIEARNKLVESNQRLVVRAANYYAQKFSDPGIIEDFLQIGKIGLISAAKDWDPRLSRFSTYAEWWIKQSIQRAIVDEYFETIRTPPHAVEKRIKIFKFINRFKNKHRRDPSVGEIADHLGLYSEKAKKKIKEFLFMMATTMNRETFLSLDASTVTASGDEIYFGDTITSSELNPEQLLDAKEDLKEALQRLESMRNYLKSCGVSERNVEILWDRFGLDGSFEIKTLDEVSKNFENISRQRIEQIIKASILKLRHFEIRNWHQLEFEIERIKRLQELISASEA